MASGCNKKVTKERRFIITQPVGWKSLVSTLLYLAVATGLAIHCYRYSSFEIDLLGYSASIALAETGDIVKAHRQVYEHPLTPHLRGLDETSKQAADLRQRAADPYYAAQFLPYFAIKPLYILALQAVHKLGFDVIDSSRAVSAFFYFAIAVTLWLYSRSWLGLLVMVLPELMLVGQVNEPDSMSCFFLLFGLWLVFMKRRDMGGMLVLLLAVWVRPENLLLTMLVIFVLWIRGRLEFWKGAVLAFLCLGSDMLINHFGYPWQVLYQHLMTAVPGTGSSTPLRFYAHALLASVIEALHGAGSLFLLLWLVCFPLVEKEYRWVMGVTLVFSIGRFVIFPLYETRYYAPFFASTALAGVLVISRMPVRRWLSDKLSAVVQN